MHMVAGWTLYMDVCHIIIEADTLTREKSIRNEEQQPAKRSVNGEHTVSTLHMHAFARIYLYPTIVYK